jgi:hypothetical protein
MSQREPPLQFVLVRRESDNLSAKPARSASFNKKNLAGKADILSAR